MERGLKIKLDPKTLTWSFEAVGVGVGSGSDHDREKEETYHNRLFNGRMEVQDPTGKISVYEDGCHLVERPEAYGIITAMSKPEYEEFCGRPGSANED